jgi:hypothetical protein
MVAFSRRIMRLSFIPLKKTQEWTMNLYTGLLFHHGHIADPALAVSLANDGHRDEGDDARRPAEPRRVRERRAVRGVFRRGAIAAACCSTALSPFR